MAQQVFYPLPTDGYILASSSNSSNDGGVLIAGRVVPLGPPGTIARMVLPFDLSTLHERAVITGATLNLPRVGGQTVGTPTYTCSGLLIENLEAEPSWNSPWTTPGGDIDPNDGDTVIYSGSGPMAFTALGNLVKRLAPQPVVGLMVTGPEELGPSNHFITYSSQGADPVTLTVDYELTRPGCATAEALLKWTATATVEGCSRRHAIMGYEVFEVGSVAKVPVAFRNEGGGLNDPDSVHVTITDPDGNESTYTAEQDAEVQHTDVGLYTALVALSTRGMWKARWWSEGEGEAAVTVKMKAVAP